MSGFHQHVFYFYFFIFWFVVGLAKSLNLSGEESGDDFRKASVSSFLSTLPSVALKVVELPCSKRVGEMGQHGHQKYHPGFCNLLLSASGRQI